MAIFKAPRITTNQRINLILQEAEIVFDTDLKTYFGADGVTAGGYAIGRGAYNPPNTEKVIITRQDLDRKYLILSKTPFDPKSVWLLPEGGIPQFCNIDFRVEDNLLRWDGMGLDNFLEENEILLISY